MRHTSARHGAINRIIALSSLIISSPALVPSAVAAPPQFQIIDVGLTGPEYTADTGHKESRAIYLNEAGQVAGESVRYDGGSQFGVARGNSAWLFNGTTTINVGLTGPEHTSGDGSNGSYVTGFNEAGQVAGYAFRFQDGGGYSAWLYNGTTTNVIGLTGPEHTRNDGYKDSVTFRLNQAGELIGTSTLYNGGHPILGQSAWLYNGSSTIEIGLAGPEFTGSDGAKRSDPYQLNEAGHAIGTTRRYGGGDSNSYFGESAWFYNGSTTSDIGLSGPEHTRDDGYQENRVLQLTPLRAVIEQDVC